jgi:hypothetical protein
MNNKHDTGSRGLELLWIEPGTVPGTTGRSWA